MLSLFIKKQRTASHCILGGWQLPIFQVLFLMKLFYGLDVQQWYYYIPFYTPSAVMGAAMGVATLLILKRSGVLNHMKDMLER